jgi:hypothetical protein
VKNRFQNLPFKCNLQRYNVAPLSPRDSLRSHPLADQLKVAWFPVRHGKYVRDHHATRAVMGRRATAAATHASSSASFSSTSKIGARPVELGVVVMHGAVKGIREDQPWRFKNIPDDMPVVGLGTFHRVIHVILHSKHQLMTAGTVHVTNLTTPRGSGGNPTRWWRWTCGATETARRGGGG